MQLADGLISHCMSFHVNDMRLKKPMFEKLTVLINDVKETCLDNTPWIALTYAIWTTVQPLSAQAQVEVFIHSLLYVAL